MFPERTHASSTKGWTGHTLGAAGALEAVITLLSLESGLMPGNLNHATLDAACGPQVRLDECAGHRAPRAQQFIRVRRQQLRAAVLRGRGGVNLLANTGTAVREWRRVVVAAPAGMGARQPHPRRGEEPAPRSRAARPSPELLPPTERRRAPDTVVGGAGGGAGRLQVRGPCARRRCRRYSAPCTATSPSPTTCARHGVDRPRWYHPRNFTIRFTTRRRVTGPSPPNVRDPTPRCRRARIPSAPALLETCVQALDRDENVLLVAYDIDARGPLAPRGHSKGTCWSVGAGRVAPSAGRMRSAISISNCSPKPGHRSCARPENAALVAGNSSESCLPLMEALARGGVQRDPVPCHSDARTRNPLSKRT